MSRRIWTTHGKVFSLLVVAVAFAGSPMTAKAAQPRVGQKEVSGPAATHWEGPAQMHGAFFSKEHGTLIIDGKGITFRAGNGRNQRWTFADIHTVVLAPHRLVLKTWIHRGWPRPGEREYRLDLTQVLPPAVAASLARGVGRPSKNTDLNPDAPAVTSIGVRHRTLTGGTNGMLRFRSDGIDYVTASSGDGRSWRWADLQTLSDPDPYHLSVFGYKDTYTFELKAPLSRNLVNWAMDQIYAHSESTQEPSRSIPNESARSAAGEQDE